MNKYVKYEYLKESMEFGTYDIMFPQTPMTKKVSIDFDADAWELFLDTQAQSPPRSDIDCEVLSVFPWHDGHSGIIICQARWLQQIAE